MVGKTNVKALWDQVKTYTNVVGYAPVLKPRVRNGRERRGGWFFRVFVSVKQPEDVLEAEDVLPRMLNGIPLDVVAFAGYFKDEIVLSGEFILIDNAYMGESCFLYA